MTEQAALLSSDPAGPASERERERERGSGTVLALGLCLLLILALGMVLMVGQGLAASARAAAAADLAALAAADAERGLRTGRACDAGRAVAELNGAVLIRCEVEITGSTVRVIVEIPTGAPWGPAPGRARAGPPAPAPGP